MTVKWCRRAESIWHRYEEAERERDEKKMSAALADYDKHAVNCDSCYERSYGRPRRD